MDEVTQVLFGMNGFRVLDAAVDQLDGELGVLVETINPGRGCPDCGVVGQVKQRPVVSVRDATSAGRRVRVRWQKRRWACLERTCERGSWTEQHDEVGARRRTTRRCREQVAKAVTICRVSRFLRQVKVGLTVRRTDGKTVREGC